MTSAGTYIYDSGLRVERAWKCDNCTALWYGGRQKCPRCSAQGEPEPLPEGARLLTKDIAMKHDVTVEARKKLHEILVKRHGRELFDTLAHDLQDLLHTTIQDAYKAGAIFYKETSGLQIGLEKAKKNRHFKGKLQNIKQLNAKRTQGKWYRAHEGLYASTDLKSLVATCQNPGFEFADARFLSALVDVWPMLEEMLED